MSAAAPLPVTVLGGYLGAGKTTLLNRLLANTAGRRWGIIVNDIGEISVDASLVHTGDDGAAGDVLTLANGCVCCSLADGFAVALDTLRQRSSGLDSVVIEVSGVGDPWKVAQWGRTPGFVLGEVVVVVDAETVVERANDRLVGDTVLRQLTGADLILASRLDLQPDPEATRTELAAWLGRHTVAPLVTEAVALGAGSSWLSGSARSAGPVGGPPRADAVTPSSLGADGEAHARHVVHTVVPAANWAPGRWREVLAAAPSEIVRVKGFVTDPEGATVLVQRAGRRVEVTRWGAAGTAPTLTVILAPGSGSAAEHWLADVIDRAGQPPLAPVAR